MGKGYFDVRFLYEWKETMLRIKVNSVIIVINPFHTEEQKNTYEVWGKWDRTWTLPFFPIPREENKRKHALNLRENEAPYFTIGMRKIFNNK